MAHNHQVECDRDADFQLGNFKIDVEVVSSSLEDEEENLEGEEKAQFLAFIRKMLQWRPEDRLSAKELLGDPWLSALVKDDEDADEVDDQEANS
jgi:serine/threonine protein kinase